LDSFPLELWCDLPSLLAFVQACDVFNARVYDCFPEVDLMSETVAADMVDCFHHIPCAECPRIWSELRDYWREKGFLGISVPRRRGGDISGRLGKVVHCDLVYVSFDDISAVMVHFAATNYIRICGLIGREIQGVPMGDALSCAALRLFKWDRSRARSSVEGRESVRFRSEHVQLVQLHGRNMLVLDVSFCDHLLFFAFGIALVTSHPWMSLLGLLAGFVTVS
jgi:hypothetical protein